MPLPSIQDATPDTVLDTDPGSKSLTSNSALETEVSAAMSNIAENLTPQDADAVGEIQIASLSTEEIQQKLGDVEEELLSVKNEAKLIFQLVILAREERKVLQERKKLRGYC
ncbi:hypothetical protein HDV57DRAFT_366354 [Trichoderma longibrachiatum]